MSQSSYSAGEAGSLINCDTTLKTFHEILTSNGTWFSGPDIVGGVHVDVYAAGGGGTPFGSNASQGRKGGDTSFGVFTAFGGEGGSAAAQGLKGGGHGSGVSSGGNTGVAISGGGAPGGAGGEGAVETGWPYGRYAFGGPGGHGGRVSGILLASNAAASNAEINYTVGLGGAAGVTSGASSNAAFQASSGANGWIELTYDVRLGS